MESEDRPTWLYQAHCEHDGLLYVGIAYDVERRIQQHRATKSWWPDVSSVVAGQLSNRRHAQQIESRIIRGVLPPHNIAGRATPNPSAGAAIARLWVVLNSHGRLLDERRF